MKEAMMFYVYVLQSKNDVSQFYIGCTSDLRCRLHSHNAGKNRATRGSQWELVYYEAYCTESAAWQREKRLKHHGNAKQSLLKRIKEMLGLPSPKFPDK